MDAFPYGAHEEGTIWYKELHFHMEENQKHNVDLENQNYIQINDSFYSSWQMT